MYCAESHMHFADGWINRKLVILRLFKQCFIISQRLEDDNERLRTMESRLRLERFQPTGV